jgi:hypothetical protein
MQRWIVFHEITRSPSSSTLMIETSEKYISALWVGVRGTPTKSFERDLCAMSLVKREIIERFLTTA